MAPAVHTHTIGYYSTANASDLNTTLGTGQFSWSNTSTNTPDSYGQGINIVSSGTAHNNSNNWITQLAFSTLNNAAYFRGKTNSSSWNSWHTFYHTGNKPTKSDVDLGNVTNESKTTMFANPTFTGTASIGSGPPSWTIDDTTSSGNLSFIKGTNKMVIKNDGVYFNDAKLGAGSGTVTGVTATSPLSSSGGTTPKISVVSGYAIPTTTQINN